MGELKSLDKIRTMKLLEAVRPEIADMLLTLESEMIGLVETNNKLERELRACRDNYERALDKIAELERENAKLNAACTAHREQSEKNYRDAEAARAEGEAKGRREMLEKAEKLADEICECGGTYCLAHKVSNALDEGGE